MHNIVDNIKIEQVLMPQTIAASALNSGNIDMQGAQSVAVAVMVGDISETLSTSAKITLKIEHGDDTSSYEACEDTDVLNFSGLASGVFIVIDSDAEAQKRHVVEYVGGKRYVKVTATPAGLSTGGALAMVALKSNFAQKPVNNS